MKKIFFFIFLFFSCNKQPAREKNFNSHIGIYILDINRTNLGDYYIDSNKYKNLKIHFNKDSTFEFNMEVPFVLEKKGKWVADGGDFESWNWLQFNSKLNGENMDIGIGKQFTQIYEDKKDSIFYIRGITPKNNFEFIQKIYFKKIKNK